MLDKEFFEFKDSGMEKEADYTPKYQLTKLASDRYQFYSFEDKKAQLCSAKNVLKCLANVRGGRYLDRNLTAKVLSMGNLETITVAGSALVLNKKAGYNKDYEPWKVVAVNGIEYFVAADAEDTEEEAAKKVTASAKPIEHTYTVHITAHNVREIIKIANCATEKMVAVPGTIQVPTQEQISFDVKTEGTPGAAQTSIQKALENEGIYLPDTAVGVYNDSCPCGCGKQVHEHKHVSPQVTEPGDFVLVPEGTNKQVFASTLETLKAHASANYSSYKIYDSNKKVVASVLNNKDNMAPLDPESSTFGEDLTAFLMKQHALNTTAGDQVSIIKQDGTERPATEEVQPGDTVVDQKGVAKKITNVEAQEENKISTTAAEPETNEEQPKNDNVAYNGQPVKDEGEPNASKDKADDVKRWKGMKQDENSGKYVVYITESTERVFDTPDAAIDYMTRA